jgi:SAM-dependent methyltransferase
VRPVRIFPTLPRVPRDYTFHDVDQCNMCAAPVDEAKVLGRRLSSSQGVRPTRRTGISTTVMRCRRCGLVFANPLPVPGDIAQHYDTPPAEYWQPRYFEPEPDYYGPIIETFRRLWSSDGSHPPRALDVGAGIGKAMRALDAAGFDAHGIEPSAAFRQAAIDHGAISPDRLQLGAIETVDYQPGSFEFVTFGAVLEHVADPAGAIDCAMRWLTRGGLIHAEVPSARWLTARLVNVAYRLQGLDYVTNLSPMHPPYHLYEFTERSFEAHAARSGYSIAFTRLMTGRESYLPGPDAAWRWLQDRTGTGMQLEVWLSRPS